MKGEACRARLLTTTWSQKITVSSLQFSVKIISPWNSLPRPAKLSTRCQDRRKKKKDIFSNTDISKSSPAQTLFLESYWGMHSTKTKVSTEKEEGMDPETTGSKHRKKAGGNRSIPTKWDLKPTPCSRSGEPQCRLEQRTWSPPIFPVKKNRSITWCVWT